jgi:hypothetical protein
VRFRAGARAARLVVFFAAMAGHIAWQDALGEEACARPESGAGMRGRRQRRAVGAAGPHAPPGAARPRLGSPAARPRAGRSPRASPRAPHARGARRASPPRRHRRRHARRRDHDDPRGRLRSRDAERADRDGPATHAGGRHHGGVLLGLRRRQVLPAPVVSRGRSGAPRARHDRRDVPAGSRTRSARCASSTGSASGT